PGRLEGTGSSFRQLDWRWWQFRGPKGSGWCSGYHHRTDYCRRYRDWLYLDGDPTDRSQFREPLRSLEWSECRVVRGFKSAVTRMERARAPDNTTRGYHCPPGSRFPGSCPVQGFR